MKSSKPGQPAHALAEDGPRTARFDIYEAALIGVDPDIAIDLQKCLAPAGAIPATCEIAPSLDPRTG